MDAATIIGVILLAALAFANGANDVSKGIATLAGSGVTNYRKAILWGTVWTFAGGALAVFFASAMVKTFSNGILSNTGMFRESPALIISVMAGATGWVMLATRTGLPVSTTHAITGSLCGAGLAAMGWDGILWSSLIHKVVVPLAFSPLIAAGISLLLFPVVRSFLSGWEGHCICVLPMQRAVLAMEQTGIVRMVPAQTELVTVVDAPQCEAPQVLSLRIGTDTFHWITSGLTSLARGLNDAPKMAALLVGFSLMSNDSVPHHQTLLIFGVVALSMAMGSFLGGLKVSEVLAEKITRMDHQEGFSANLTTALLVTVAARFGLPVSTTHVSSGAIIGTGLRNGTGRVNWKTVSEMLLAWMITLPAAAALSAGAYFLLTR